MNKYLIDNNKELQIRLQSGDLSNCIFNIPITEPCRKFEYIINFTNSEFKKEVNFSLCEFKNNIIFYNAIFLDKVTFGSSIFNKNLDFSNIKKSEKNVSFTKSKFFGKFECSNSIFEGEIDFQEVKFKDTVHFTYSHFNDKVIFKYTIFENFVYFMGAKFNQGLNLNFSSFEKDVNFYAIDIKSKNTSQETFRIIKHSFEKLGNKIEANKYHALELEQKRRQLEKEKPRNWNDYLIFMLHDLSSEHSTNWFRVILWIIIIGSLTTILLDNNLCDIVNNISLINLTSKEAIPTEKLSLWQSLVIFFNKISLGYLYYQFILSVRKDTRK